MRTRFIVGAITALVGSTALLAPEIAGAVDYCSGGYNEIVCENSKPGTPMENWYSPNAYGEIGGFTDKSSYSPGQVVNFRVQSPVPYKVSIYRLGYYNGDGARKMPDSPAATFPAITQPTCAADGSTGLVDCGNWSVTASWVVPTEAVSGLYVAMLDQTDTNGVMPYPFVVKPLTNDSDIVIQTSDQTWQAYNDWGGQDLYGGGGPAPDGRAYKVSYNRPLDVGGDNGIFASEYALIHWIERNGYDVSYLSSIDVTTTPSILLDHKVFMSSGHDEYWNQAQWDNVTAAREAGVDLAFFSGNEVFWRTRFEPAFAGGTTPNRTLVCYKMTKMKLNNGIADPSGQWTGTWMDPDGTGTGGNQPQNKLTGTLFRVNGYRTDALTVPYAFSDYRLWRNTSVDNLTEGQTATFQLGTLGYEWDVDEENGHRPDGAIQLSSTTLPINDGTLLLDNGNTYGNGTATHSLVAYKDASSGAIVFGAGTVQWSWGLSEHHAFTPTTQDQRLQQATVNLLADMGVQPQTRQTNLMAASASTDTTGPTTAVTTPTSGQTVPLLSNVNISGTATEVGGGKVARTEVSTDGGTTWKKAEGTTAWSYIWTPMTEGAATIKVRSIDDSLNIGTITTINLTVGPQDCPCTVFPSTVVPAVPAVSDFSAVELGAKFRTTTPATAVGVRFYKGTGNTGTHIGRIWNRNGVLLASGTFANESASGWQTLTFDTPIPLAANTTFVVSYYAPVGRYSADLNYFANHGAGTSPVYELQNGVDGPNGLYRYGTGGGFPTNSYQSSNYWVEPVVDTGSAPQEAPEVSAVTPVNGATGVAINTSVTATFDSAIDSSTLQYTLTGPGGQEVPSFVSYDPATKVATLSPDTQLANSATYTASVRAGDAWGNVMPSAHTWSFTTGTSTPPLTCPCSLWTDSHTPANANSGDTNAVELGLKFTASVNGQVTGVRFYKGSNNTGTHTGRLWTSAGVELASGTFAGESASGWQTLTFNTPVSVTAGTMYVVSYHAPAGNYSYSGGYFANARSIYPLTGLAGQGNGGNGVYRYGAAGTFPAYSWNNTNYWVDVVFTAS